MPNNKSLYVIFLVLFGNIFAALMATSVKFLSGDLNPIIICFYRCLMGLILMFPFITINNFAALKSNNIKLQFSRSIINIASMICWFSAIGMMHLEKATALGFTTPLFTTILAVLILREVIRLHRITALIIGFLGVLIIIKPGYVPFEIGTLLMLIASFSFSFVLIIVKKLSAIDSSQTIVFYNLFFMTPVFFILSILFWQTINLNQLFIFIFMGAAGIISHLCLSQALKLGDTTFVMPLQFTKLIWASIIGLLLFSEIPDFWTWIGGIFVFASVIYITYRETFKKRGTEKTVSVDQAIIN